MDAKKIDPMKLKPHEGHSIYPPDKTPEWFVVAVEWTIAVAICAIIIYVLFCITPNAPETWNYWQ